MCFSWQETYTAVLTQTEFAYKASKKEKFTDFASIFPSDKNEQDKFSFHLHTDLAV